MSGTKIRSSRYPKAMTMINGVPISNNEDPLDDKTIVYNSTSGYYEYQSVIPLNSDTVNGDVNFTGTVQIGTDGNPISQLDAGSVTIDTDINTNSSISDTVDFAGTFDSAPIVILGIESAAAGDTQLVANITTISTTQFGWNIYNDGADVTETMTLHWLAILGF